MGSNSIPQKTLSDESINRGLVCAHMHFMTQTQKILTFMSQTGECRQQKHTQHAPSTKTECDYLNGWIKKRSHTQKSHPKMVNPRDIAGEHRKKESLKPDSNSRNSIGGRLGKQLYSHGFIITVVNHGPLLALNSLLLEGKVLLKHRREAVPLQQGCLLHHRLPVVRHLLQVEHHRHVVACSTQCTMRSIVSSSLTALI